MISREELTETLAAEPAEEEARPSEPPMDEIEFEDTVRRLIDNARDIMDEEVLPELEAAWRYYNGRVDQEPMGLIGRHEETGELVYEGSKAVLTECFDQVQTLLPDIYRVIAGSEEAIAFQPESEEDAAYVEQANDYIRHLFWDRNPGEELLKDGLLEWMIKFCAFRVWREQSFREHVREFADLDDMQLFALQQEPNVEVEVVETHQREMPVPQLTPEGAVVWTRQPQQFHSVVCRYYEPYGRTRVDLVPQDEVLVDLEAQTIDEATVLGTDGERRVSDLIALGLDEDLVMEMKGKGLRRGVRSTDIRQERANTPALERTYRDNIDPSLQWVRTVDARVMVDRDRDGRAEAWRVIMLGEPLKMAYAVEDPGSDTIVLGSPFPRPHRLIGDGVVENTMDLQEIGTSIIRRTLDNFARSIQPREVVRGGDEETFDALQSWFGGAVPIGPNGQIDWHVVPFNGDAALPLLQFFEQRRTLRTGISPAAQGLDPRALKGQTLDAVAGILAGPQSRHEGFAREFCTRILKNVFRAMLRITVSYQDRAEVIRLRNKFVSVDPSQWNPSLDVQVEVGLGTGSRMERMIASNAVLQKQEQLAGAEHPMLKAMFDVQKYRQALADLTHALGTKDDARYFPELDDDTLQQLQAQAQQEQARQAQQALQVQEAMTQAEERAKAQAEIAVEQAKSMLEREAKEREISLEGLLQQTQARLEGLIKERLLQVEARLEERLMRARGSNPAAQGNIQRRA